MQRDSSRPTSPPVPIRTAIVETLEELWRCTLEADRRAVLEILESIAPLRGAMAPAQRPHATRLELLDDALDGETA